MEQTLAEILKAPNEIVYSACGLMLFIRLLITRRLRLVARRLHLVASWLVARWFLGGELVGGEIPWWRGNRIPNQCIRHKKSKNGWIEIVTEFLRRTTYLQLLYLS